MNWDRIREVYGAAIALPREERSAFVARGCLGEAELEREIISLLAAENSLNGFLEVPVFELKTTPDNLVGATIGERYFVKGELGHSAMSEVYLAIDQRLEPQQVVIKILSETLVQNRYARQRFDQEVEALLRIDHPNVVRVLDRGALPDGRPYIVMQYIDGEMLRSQIRPGGMNLDQAAAILRQMGNALDHVHEKRIFHRDLKPENIMLKGGTESVVLIDFGIAKVTDSLVAQTTRDNMSPGTLVYMSPEQLRGERVTSDSDIYSMAVVAYEMVTGSRPFNPSSASQLLDLQRAGAGARPISLRPNLSPQASDIIVRGLSYKPSARYQKAGDFSAALATALSGKEVPALPPPLVQRRIPAIVALIVVLSTASWFTLFKYRRVDGGLSRSFSYWLTVQRMQDGKEYEKPYKSNGEGTFDSGDKFQFNVFAPIPGYFYLLNEGPPEVNDTSFKMLYPNRTTNGGSASLGANQTIQSDWIIFRGPSGDENFWMVWSVDPVSPLESAKTEAFKDPRGGLDDQTLTAVKDFLQTKQLETKVTVYHFQREQTATPRGKGDILVTLIQIKHR